ncbi:MAG: ABC transporter ATP-binding protein [Candidatus Aminicenantes bacterium]|jgi:putative ABC transport system ATP-binding protein|nr:ABC transporter ATP-binding protein [Candidatus Aminicenantes bacterium]MDH5742228.1 ABC transporter ATP-binding protein [Candidatus Aminicenantes bacterium]
MENNVLIQMEDVNRTYNVGETQVRALREFSLSIQKGELLAVMGPSGSGKSTLMNIIGCLDKPTSGRYFLEGLEVSKLNKNQLARIRNKKIGFVFQNFNLLARTTALENTELPLLYSDIPAKKTRELALKALAQVGLAGRELHKTNQLSGGEMQRVAIARALVNSPSLLLADEPTGNLDTKTGNEIMSVVEKLNKENNITVILVTHDPEVVEIARKTIFLRDGLIEKVQVNGE